MTVTAPFLSSPSLSQCRTFAKLITFFPFFFVALRAHISTFHLEGILPISSFFASFVLHPLHCIWIIQTTPKFACQKRWAVFAAPWKPDACLYASEFEISDAWPGSEAKIPDAWPASEAEIPDVWPASQSSEAVISDASNARVYCCLLLLLYILFCWLIVPIAASHRLSCVSRGRTDVNVVKLTFSFSDTFLN